MISPDFNLDFASSKEGPGGACPGTPPQLRTIAPIATPTTLWAEFPAAASSAGEARRFLRDALADWDLDALCDTATLLVSELVANAVLHAGTVIGVGVRLDGRRVRVEVHDGDSRVPARKHYSSLATTGRGLMLVERLATGWGVNARGAGKHVWFELDGSIGGAEPLPGAAELDLAAFGDAFDEDFGGFGAAFDADPPPGSSRSGGPRALAGARC